MSTENVENKKRYDAFISYRHSELDSFVATTLHRKLEGFKLPKNVHAKNGKKGITRIFRDEDELPIASSLSDQIEYALSETDFLIVICSPRLPESKWCAKEIETFIKLYGRERILAVLVEGEPSESFPEALTREEVEVIGPNGEKTIEVRHVEPLAADVRGANEKEIRKKMDDVVLRIAAPMFELNYDDLKQRHREQKMKRIISGVSVACAIMLVFCAVCLGMLLRIKKQSDEIAKQNTEIQEQNDAIAAQNEAIEAQKEKIEEQYIDAAKRYAVATVDNARKLMASGRNKAAIYALRQVMPDSLTDTTVPYTSETHEMLVEALELYPSRFICGNVFEADCKIKEMLMTPDDKTVAAMDSNEFIWIWDAETGELINDKIKSSSYIGDNFAFADNENLIYYRIFTPERKAEYEEKIQKEMDEKYPDDKTTAFFEATQMMVFIDGDIVKYNPRTQETTVLVEGARNNYFVHSFTDQGISVVSTGGDVYVFDMKSDSVIGTILMNDIVDDEGTYGIFSSMNSCVLSDDGAYLAYSFDHSDTCYQIIYDINNGTVKMKKELEGYQGGTPICLTAENKVIFCHNQTFVLDTTYLSCYDIETGKEEWSATFDAYVTDMTDGGVVNDTDCFLVVAYSNMIFIDKKNGKMVRNDSLDNQIITNEYYPENNVYRIAANNGEMYYYIIDSATFYDSITNQFTYPIDMKLDKVFFTNSGMFMLPHSEQYITFYKGVPETDYERLTLPEDAVESINKAGTYYIVSRYEDGITKFAVCDVKTGEKVFMINSESSDMEFVGDGSSEVFLLKENVVYNFLDGTKTRTVRADEELKYSLWYVSADRLVTYSKTISFSEEPTILTLFSLETGEKIGTVEPQTPIENEDRVYVASEDAVIIIRHDSFIAELYKPGQNTPIATKTIVLEEDYSGFVSDDGKYFCSQFSDGRLDMYSIENGFEKKTFYNDFAIASDMKKIAGTDMYLLVAMDSFILNKDMEIIYRLPYSVDVFIPEEKVFFAFNAAYAVKYPYYEYDELVKIADGKIGDYFPSEREFGQYNISEK